MSFLAEYIQVLARRDRFRRGLHIIMAAHPTAEDQGKTEGAPSRLWAPED